MKRFIILALLLLAGCGALPDLQKQQKVELPPNVDVGTDALVVTLKPTATDIFMCGQSNIVATLQNKGTDLITGDYQVIIENQIFKLENSGLKSGGIDLFGKSRNRPRGEQRVLTFNLKNSGLPQNLETYRTPFIFRSCYDYATKATLQACVDPDIYKQEKTKACQTTPITTQGGQGAPVVITQVEQIMMPVNKGVRPAFMIQIENQGIGKVVGLDSVDFVCEGFDSSQKSLRPIVNIKAKLGGIDLKCGRGTIEIKPAGAQILCTSEQTVPAASASFTSPLQIEATYGYYHTNTLPLSITRLPGQDPCPATSR